VVTGDAGKVAVCTIGPSTVDADAEANADAESNAADDTAVTAADTTAATAADTTAAATDTTATDTPDTHSVNTNTNRLDLNGGHPCGVRLVALQQLLDAAEAAGLDREGVATEELCTAVVLPATSERRCAYAALLPPTMLAPATHFVSHAWAGRYAELLAVVSAVVVEERAAGRPEPVFWVDVAVNNQHEAPQRPFSWWRGTFRRSIAAIGKVILVLAPWNDPRPLRRAWCLWEIFCASGIGLPPVGEDGETDTQAAGGMASPDGAVATLDVRLPPSEQAGFECVLIEEMRAALDVLVAVQAERAEAFLPEDRDNIFRAIEASEGGFAAVNAVVKNQLRMWLVSAALRAAEQRVAQGTIIENTTPDAHALAEADNGASANDVDPDAEARRAQAIEGANLFNNVAVTLHDLVDLESSAKYGERAVDLYRRLVGTSDFRLASALQNLAVVKAAQGRLTEAGAAYREALDMKIAIFGEDHPSTADTLNNLGRLLHETGTVIVLTEQSSADGSCRFGTLSLYCFIALTSTFPFSFIRPGHPEEALALLKRALVVRERQAEEERAAATSESDGMPGDASPALPANVAVSLGNALHNTAQVLMQLGQLEEALDYLQRGLAVRLASLGEQHPDTASSYNDLAIVYRELGRTKDAVAALEGAIAILENVFGESHPRVATAYNNFAVMQEGAGDYEGALEGYKRSLRIKEALLPENHPSIARTVLNIGNVYFTGLKRPEETLKFYQRALAMRLAVLGAAHPDVADSHFNMAALLEYMGRREEALTHAQVALSIYREVYTADHKDVTSAERQVARLLDEPSAESG
jgi:tetratricopeptide (TPR) repeat protein